MNEILAMHREYMMFWDKREDPVGVSFILVAS